MGDTPDNPTYTPAEYEQMARDLQRLKELGDGITTAQKLQVKQLEQILSLRERIADLAALGAEVANAQKLVDKYKELSKATDGLVNGLKNKIQLGDQELYHANAQIRLKREEMKQAEKITQEMVAMEH